MFGIFREIIYRKSYGKVERGLRSELEYQVEVTRLKLLWVTIWTGEKTLH